MKIDIENDLYCKLNALEHVLKVSLSKNRNYKICFTPANLHVARLLELAKHYGMLENANEYCIIDDNKQGELFGIKIHPIEDFPSLGIDLVIPLGDKSSTEPIIEKLKNLQIDHDLEFSLNDKVFGYPDSGVISYRGTEFVLYKGGLCPCHQSNFAFINYLVQDVVKNGDKVVDICAGAGPVGFSLLNECDIGSISFIDLNYQSIRSIKATIERNNLFDRGIKYWLSDGFDNVPGTEKFDLIVGNPPMIDRQALTFRELAGFDHKFEFHKQFFSRAHEYLNNRGKICLLEDGHYTECEQFRDMLKNYPRLKFVKHKRFRGSKFYAMSITLA